jgi:hypothetical protein
MRRCSSSPRIWDTVASCRLTCETSTHIVGSNASRFETCCWRSPERRGRAAVGMGSAMWRCRNSATSAAYRD